MKNFSQIILEERKNYSAVALLQSEISSYISKVNKVLPKNIQDIIAMTEKYGLVSAQDIDDIRNCNKSQLGKLAEKHNIPLNQMELLHALLKQASRNIRLLPQYQSPYERAAIEAGKLATDDLTIDLETQSGRNAAAKMYAPLVLKIANQYVGKSRLDRPSLISAGMAGLAAAMNDWKKDGDDNGRKTTFRTYASYRIQQAILNEINTKGHSLSGTNWYSAEKYGAAALDAVSIDGFSADDDDDFQQDRMMGLSVDPFDMDKDVSKEEQNWKEVFKMMEDKFSTRDMDIFYRYFGLGPYHGKRQKSKDIAKEYGMSEGNIRNSIINKIIKFLQTNPKAIRMMTSLRTLYTESLLAELINMNKEEVLEALYRDNTYIMLEEITRWDNKQALIHAVHAACDKMDIDGAKFILNCLTQGLDYFNSNLRKNKKLVVFFLSEVYPSENMSRKTDVELANYMSELIEGTKTFKIDW